MFCVAYYTLSKMSGKGKEPVLADKPYPALFGDASVVGLAPVKAGLSPPS